MVVNLLTHPPFCMNSFIYFFNTDGIVPYRRKRIINCCHSDFRVKNVKAPWYVNLVEWTIISLQLMGTILNCELSFCCLISADNLSIKLYSLMVNQLGPSVVIFWRMSDSVIIVMTAVFRSLLFVRVVHHVVSCR